jgi:predicted esterase
VLEAAFWTVIMRLLIPALLAISVSLASADPINRRLPPGGIELPADQQREIEAARSHVAERLAGIPKDHRRRPDLEVFHKAISYALEFGEFYNKGGLKTVREIVIAADRCAEEIAANKENRRGLRVCGYVSSIDGSVQPYGLEVPEKLDLTKPVSLWVWLHGRGDKETDLYFISNRLKKLGNFTPQNAIVLHPFGRQCIGWKSAGEIDVLEAINDVAQRYQIDRDRIALMGFSMGGAGAWHIGAHYTDRFALVHAGAGFAETAQYNRLKPDDYPPVYEQTLWGVYDAPNYVRNLFNVPVIAYSGEIDKQIQAAQVMEAAFEAESRTLKHLIGPKMGHKYDPETQQAIAEMVTGALEEGRDVFAKSVSLQTQTLRYNRMHWITATGLEKHWEDSRIDAKRSGSAVQVKTKNINEFSIATGKSPLLSMTVDGVALKNPPTMDRVFLHKADGAWKSGKLPPTGLRKLPGMQGPIDDAFLAPFLVVLPDKKSESHQVQAWVEFELAHFEQRWRATFRGKLRKKKASEVTAEDTRSFNLVAFGEPQTNSLIATAVGAWDDLDWGKQELSLAGQQVAAVNHLPLMIRPNPANPKKYLVINSGPTFREGHDRTNSLQNPKLPDWAIINLEQKPSDLAAGRVVAAGFFDESWK